jgi:F-type H+-transporting ATPase subunit alpha
MAKAPPINLDAPFEAYDELGANFTPAMEVVEQGTVVSAGGGIVKVQGLPGVEYLELVLLRASDGTVRKGLAIDLSPDGVAVALLDDPAAVLSGAAVRRSGRVLGVPAGVALIGRVVDGLGRPLDGQGPIVNTLTVAVERDAPPIMDRQAVATPLQTGILAIDTLIPIGRGQRELIVGDRQTGKTAIAVDAIINQKGTGVIAIYCAVGVPLSSVATVIDDLRANGAMEHTIAVVASGHDTPGLNFIAPFAATSMGEWFMEQGRDVMIVYDDLIHHARSYRELSLLTRRPPAREAFPGDIFYLHSRLLERATHLSAAHGGGSLTALPIIETEAQNISAYIPTNLISITDGQIYLSPRLFSQAQLPAIDVMRSVSRVGGQAQIPALRSLSGELRLQYAQFEELESFSRFDAALDEATKATLERGKRAREILKQTQLAPMSAAEQVVLLIALNAGIFDRVPIDRIKDLRPAIARLVANELRETAALLEKGAPIDDAMRTTIGALVSAIRDHIVPVPEPGASAAKATGAAGVVAVVPAGDAHA